MPTFTISRRHAVLVVACALVFLLVASRFVAGGSSNSATPTPVLAAPSAAVKAPTFVVVDIEGAVRRAGIYRLPVGSRIADAIEHAGGTTRRADKSLVNLAAPLADGEQVLVPRLGPGGVPAAGTGGTSSTAPVDLNSATVEQLDTLPGVGPVTAQKIVDFRREHGPFTSVDQLDAISGIGPSRIDNLRGHVVP